MASKPNALKEHKQRLAARKGKINDLVRGIEEHEQERESVAQSRKSFHDSKYAKKSESYWETETDEVGSVLSAENEIKRMLDTGSEKKKGNTKRVAPSASLSKAKAISAISKSQSGPGPKTIIPVADKTKDYKAPLSKVTSDPLSTAVRGSSIKISDTTIDLRTDDVEVTVDSDDDSDEEGFHHIIEALHCFQSTKYIFMQRLLDYVDIEAKGFKTKTMDLAYQILNVQGQLLFLLQQNKTKFTGFIIYAKRSFENILYDVHGNKVLKYIGPSVFMSKMTSKMIVTDSHDRTLGYIKAFGTKVNYSVYNAIGERLFLVVSNLYIPTTTTNFTILCRGQKIGIIKCGWKHTFHEYDYIDYETSGIEFPEEMDDREKALLLGCLMLIEFFWYSPLTRLKLSFLFVGLLLLLSVIIVLCIPLIHDSPSDDRTTKTFYVAEKIQKIKKSTSPAEKDSGG